LFTLQSSADDVAKGSQSCVALVLFVFQNRFMPAPAGPRRYAGGRGRKKAGDKKKQVPDKTSKVPVVFSFLPAVFPALAFGAAGGRHR